MFINLKNIYFFSHHVHLPFLADVWLRQHRENSGSFRRSVDQTVPLQPKG